MFFPTSPRPPSGMMRQTPIRASVGGGLRGGRAEDAAALEAAADLVELLLGRLDHRETEPAHLVAEQVEAGLDRDRVRLPFEEVVRGAHLVVRLPRAAGVSVPVPANHLLRRRAPDVGVHADSADPAELE